MQHINLSTLVDCSRSNQSIIFWSDISFILKLFDCSYFVSYTLRYQMLGTLTELPRKSGFTARMQLRYENQKIIKEFHEKKYKRQKIICRIMPYISEIFFCFNQNYLLDCSQNIIINVACTPLQCIVNIQCFKIVLLWNFSTAIICLCHIYA